MARYKRHQVDVPLVTGVDTSADPQMSAAGGLKTAENVYWTKDARLAKRPAFTNSAVHNRLDGTSLASEMPVCQRVRDGNEVLLTESGLYERIPSADRYYAAGKYPEMGYPTRKVVARTPERNHSYVCSAYANGFRVVAWVEETTLGGVVGALWTAVYASNGSLIFRQRLTTSNTFKPMMRRAPNGLSVMLAWVSGAAAPFTMSAAILTCSSTPSAWSGATIIYNASVAAGTVGLGVVDCCAAGSAYFFTSWDSVNLNVKKYDLALSPLANTFVVTAAEDAVGIFSDGTNVWVGWGQATPSLRYAILNHTTLGLVLGATLITGPGGIKYDRIGWESINATTAFIAWSEYGTSAAFGGNAYATKVGQLTTAGAGTIGEVTYWSAMQSRPFKWNGRYYFVVQQQGLVTAFELGYYLVEAEYTSGGNLLRPVGVFSTAGLARNSSTGLEVLSELSPTVDGYSFFWSAPEVWSWQHGIVGTSGATAWDFAMCDGKAQRPANIDRSLYLSGGLVAQYDGLNVSELGWVHGPMLALVTKAAGANTWIYAFSYLWLDTEGKQHESQLGPVTWSSGAAGQPTLGVTVTAATTPCTLNVQTYTLTAKQTGGSGATPVGNPVALRVYRTQNNSPVFRWHSDVSMNRLSDVVTITDTTADATLATAPAAYTEGGVIPNGQVLSAKHLAVWGGRLVAAIDDGARVSKASTATDPPAFVDDPSHTIEIRDGSTTEAVIVQDETLGIFKSDRIYLEQGDGPNAQGAPVYGPPRRLGTAAGCTDVRSVLVIPQGILYQSSDGLYILPRGFGDPKRIGRTVRDVQSSYPTFLDSCVDTSRQLALWAIADGTRPNASAGTLLGFDYERGQWFTWKLGTLPPFSVTLVGTTLVSTTNNGGTLVTYRAQGDTYAASGEGYVGSTLKTQNISVAGLVTGTALVPRVRVLGEYRGTCTLRVYADYDNAGTFADVRTWTFPELTGDAAGKTFVREFDLATHKCRTLAIQIADALGPDIVVGEVHTPASPSEGLVINAITLDVAEKPAGVPLHDAARG